MTVKSNPKRIPGFQSVYALLRPYIVGGGPNDQWARIVMNRETEALICSAGPEEKTALEISGQTWATRAKFKSFRSVSFPEYDICAGPLKHEKFDIVIAEQVFEHLHMANRAVRSVYEMLNPDGAFLITTPFLLKVHNHPVDCSRWTELGIRHLLAEGGFDLDHITTGSWGNRDSVQANFSKWQIYQSWRHSLKNEPDFPIVVWALARK